jgi:ABC-type branched-subunit amino acid transport system substrate-binding protein
MALCAAHLLLAGAPRLSPEQRRGRQIYLKGVGASEITAYLGNSSMDVPGSVMACANCHAQDGRGKAESGVVPSDITWLNLTKHYGLVHEDGRKHPAYTAGLLARAIQSGVDSAGNKLKAMMPTYMMSRQDLQDLIAYLQVLGDDADPGLSENGITIATLVPPRGPAAPLGAMLRSVLTSFFDDLNAQGGVYGRTIHLRVLESADSVDGTRNALRKALEEDGIFALVGGFITNADKELTSLAQELEVPFIGPSTLSPQSGHPLNRHVFYLFPGIGEEARALATFGRSDLDPAGKGAAIAYPAEDDNAATAARRSAWDGPVERYSRSPFDVSALARALMAHKAGVVLFLGSGREGVALAAEAAKLNWAPALLLPGSLAGRDLLEASEDFGGRVFLSFPMRSSDQDPAAVGEYQAFAMRHKIAAGNLAAAIAAYCGAKVFVEGLKIAGRDLSRERLVASLEGLFRFKTGLTPPITFGANRRIGAQGAYVAELDVKTRKLIPAGGWIEVE